jgi:hypothetical protein
VPTDEQRMFVMVMVGMAVKQETIAQMIAGGITQNTLLKHFSEEIKHGRERFVANIKGHLARSAQNGSVRAQTYLLDRLGGPEFAPRGRGDEPEPAIQINADARVTIFLPDNKRTENH